MSVAICTRNRERLLRDTLTQLSRAVPPRRSRWEVVVVLNDCSDGSAAVVEELRDALPIVAAVEPKPGLCHARNRAIDVAGGDVILWTDDDVLVDPQWLCAYEEAILRWPSSSVFGGPIRPRFEGVIPDWLEKSWRLCSSAFAAREVPQGGAPIVPAGDDLPFGANFAIGADAQRRVRYDVRLGRRPGRWIIGGEELAVMREILRDGTGRWVPAAVVEHVIPPERQTVGYLRAYFQGHGYLLGMQSSVARDQRSWREHLGEIRGIVAAEIEFRRLRRTADPERWVPALVAAAVAQGRWAGARRGDVVG
jgi:glucosyl-dolichyl phosphate glucuronosyltransferase